VRFESGFEVREAAGDRIWSLFQGRRGNLDSFSVAFACIPPQAEADASRLCANVGDFLGVHSAVPFTCARRLTIDAEGVEVHGFDDWLEMIKPLKAGFPKNDLKLYRAIA
jgi:hypothetical protein